MKAAKQLSVSQVLKSGWDIAAAVQPANERNLIAAFNVKHHLREALARPKPQAGNVQRIGLAQLSRAKVVPDMQICLFKRI